MYYETSGSGEPLVLLHGAFLTAESWASILPTLAGCGKTDDDGHLVLA
jgi:hypothetical protein